ncbi:conserved hypothetical lipoprotein [Leptospira biflexa serovar Patoc strain 'Patoc 1 (Ames)']|uniref:Uncharacterized protein n=1 Tax=Leptospira biflexa serovar Patoc (strain Patoc 1 / ATCC 23582 / Paris) TaxID=456481 RepID=B0SSR6_LEPBP|nr:hypothetical protein [Leptospira biflexa]ABZ94501.1 conserved hypothetical lipoprotein [Leptospira biflexa serovar Patoc strain 'Patoc 1 (Ames)']ABZ98156.1 Hypothetical protein LEPBI_I2054 [Leptospira biflexa serovar Patoc strain 'Patoc 1 (Paris)']
MLRYFAIAFSLISFVHCSQKNLSNICDVNSDSFFSSLLFRISIKDQSNHCGYKVIPDKIPACSLSYEETHKPENWAQVKLEMETQFELGVSGTESLIQYSLDSVATVLGTGYPAFQGALGAPNGNVYFLPYNAPNIVSVNPITKLYALHTAVPGGVDFIGGTLGPRGLIYLSPHQNNNFFQYNTANNQMTTIGNVTMAGAAYNGGVYAPNGKIYFVPSNETVIRYYDTNTNTIGAVATPVTGGIFANGVLTPEGKIYFIPHDATNIHILDTNTESVTVHPFSFGGAASYISGIYTPNGRIYMIPYNSSTLYYVDTKNNDSVVNAGTIPSPTSSMFNGVVLSPNGNLYPIPYNYSNFISINPTTNQMTVLMANPGVSSYRGGAIGFRGEIYLSPHNSDRFDLLDTKANGNFCDSLRLSPYWNKF